MIAYDNTMTDVICDNIYDMMYTSYHKLYI